MFIMIEYEVLTVQDFDIINSVFRSFDEAVERSGMFKYQHVSSGNSHNFVVTCPRVSRPFDLTVQQKPYPYATYYNDMLELGFELMRITSELGRSPNLGLRPNSDESDVSVPSFGVPFRARGLHVHVGLSAGGGGSGAGEVPPLLLFVW